MKFSFFKNKAGVPVDQAIDADVLSDSGGLLASFKKGLCKTRSILSLRINDLFRGGKELSGSLFDELEEILISADIGVSTSHKLIRQVQEKIDRSNLENVHRVKEYLKDSIYSILVTAEKSIPILAYKPLVMMVAGINGTGKTTTIAKLAHHYTALGYEVLLAAADTFRAAAIEQLELWSERIGCAFVRQNAGSDPSAVVHDALNAARKRNMDIVIIDTAGRMHTKTNLMEEIKKISRVSDRAYPGAPHEILLIIDATTGLNAHSQVRLFQDAVNISGIILTKLDGTSKGGVIVSLVDNFAIPIPFIGIGEGLSDLKPFKAREFTDALFNEVC